MASAAEQRIVEKAARDPVFRQQLREDPKAAIQQELGTKVRDSIEITVLEESPSHVYLVLPARYESGHEISDEDLEAVAGGDPTCPWPSTSC